MKLYDELADWWPLISPPADYEDEASVFHQLLQESCEGTPRTVLELGSGGGSNASFLKAHYKMTLVDASARMLDVSRALNPECEHLQGDMRTFRIPQKFDAVFVHDAIMYMTSEADLQAAVRTAFEHCRPGGVALFVPDCVKETFVPGTDLQGADGPDRSVRYVEWTFDPDPQDTTYSVDYVFMLRDKVGELKIVHDRHTDGLFARDSWLRVIREVGFEVRVQTDDWDRDVFIAKRPY